MYSGDGNFYHLNHLITVSDIITCTWYAARQLDTDVGKRFSLSALL